MRSRQLFILCLALPERDMFSFPILVFQILFTCLQGKDTKKVKLAQTDDIIDVDEEDLEKVRRSHDCHVTTPPPLSLSLS